MLHHAKLEILAILNGNYLLQEILGIKHAIENTWKKNLPPYNRGNREARNLLRHANFVPQHSRALKLPI